MHPGRSFPTSISAAPVVPEASPVQGSGGATTRQLPTPLRPADAWPNRQGRRATSEPDTKASGWPRISVVIASFNHATHIETAIRSVLLQDYPSLELIIMDGGSRDDTVSILRHYDPCITYWQSGPDGGIYDAMNAGIAHATGDFVYILGCDDLLMDPGVFRRFFAEPAARNADLVYGDVFFAQRRMRYGGAFSYDRMLRENRNICQQAIFYSRRAFDRVGQFETKYRILADFDFNLRLFADPDLNALYVDSVVALYNDEGASSREVDEAFMTHFIEEHIARKWTLRELYFDYIAQGFEVRRLKHVPLSGIMQRYYALRYRLLKLIGRA